MQTNLLLINECGVSLLIDRKNRRFLGSYDSLPFFFSPSSSCGVLFFVFDIIIMHWYRPPSMK